MRLSNDDGNGKVLMIRTVTHSETLENFDTVLSEAGVSSADIVYYSSRNGECCPYWAVKIEFSDARKKPVFLEVRSESFREVARRVAERLRS
jgi:hypothetical protein